MGYAANPHRSGRSIKALTGHKIYLYKSLQTSFFQTHLSLFSDSFFFLFFCPWLTKKFKPVKKKEKKSQTWLKALLAEKHPLGVSWVLQMTSLVLNASKLKNSCHTTAGHQILQRQPGGANNAAVRLTAASSLAVAAFRNSAEKTKRKREKLFSSSHKIHAVSLIP